MGDHPAIDGYLSQLSAGLTGPAAAKADLLAEARDGLRDAAYALERAGLTADRAAARAIAEFGLIDVISKEYQGELGLAQSRRTAWLVLAVFGTQPFVWGVLREAVRGSVAPVDDTVLAIKILGGACILAAILFILGSGIGLRFLPAQHFMARVVGGFGLLVAVLFTAGSLVLTLRGTSDSVLSPTGLPWTTAFLILPLSAIAVSARRCLAAAT